MTGMDGLSVIVERAVADDAPAVVDLLRCTWLDTYPNPELGLTREDIRLRVEGDHGERVLQNIDRWRNIIATSGAGHAVFVARTGGAITGMVATGVTDDGQRRIMALYVLPEAQGAGIGGALMRTALDWHGADGDVVLAVASYNRRAIGFYEHFGFQPTGRSVADEGDVPGGKLIPEIEMVLRRGQGTRSRTP